MPELGKYATEVLSAYGASLALLFALIVMTLRRGRAASVDLKRAEAEETQNG